MAALAAVASSAFTAVHLSRPAISFTRSTHRHLLRTIITSSLPPSGTTTEFNITFAPPKPKLTTEPTDSSSPSSDHDSTSELGDQLYIPWIVRDENGNLTLQTTPPARLLHALATAETKNKKKKEVKKEKQKDKDSKAKPAASSGKPTLSKAARRFYNENFRDPPQRLNKVLAAAGGKRLPTILYI